MNPLEGSTILIGYGNPGRLDDGLGPALAEGIRQCSIPHVHVESDYQLAIEHAELVARYDQVIFADAALDGAEPFLWRAVVPHTQLAFCTHQLAPETVLGLARGVFGASTVGYLLGVHGYEFDGFGERLSSQACENLAAALDWLQSQLRTNPGNMDQFAASLDSDPRNRNQFIASRGSGSQKISRFGVSRGSLGSSDGFEGKS